MDAVVRWDAFKAVGSRGDIELSFRCLSGENSRNLKNLFYLLCRCLRITVISLARVQSGRVGRANTLALMIQSRSSSPSSLPPWPPWTRRKSCGLHSISLLILFAASSLCISSMRDFSSVAASWSFRLIASITPCHNFCDSRSSCSSNGRAFGGVSLACEASKSSVFLPV